MFQYAAAYALSLRTKQELRVDISGFSGYSLHNGYELERVFQVQPTVATLTDVVYVIGLSGLPLLRRKIASPRLRLLRPRSMIVEPGHGFQPVLEAVRGPVFLNGYWQSARYFAGYEIAIRRAYRFRAQLVGANRNWADAMKNLESVMLHVRRGDYVHDPAANAFHGVLPLEYYVRALMEVKKQVNGRPLQVFVFSDDLSWSRGALSFLPNAQFVDGNAGSASHLDLQLMTCCRHHIVANSSMSWWGAWLAAPGGTVVAPRQWTRDPNINSPDRYPPEWIQI